MTFRSKFLAATLGLVMASGAVSGAFAETAPVASPKVAVNTTKMAPKTIATQTAASRTMKVAAKHHRLSVVHRGLKGKMVAHRALGRAKLAKITKIGRTHVALSHATRVKFAKRHVVRTHLVRSHIAKARFAQAQVAKVRFVKTTTLKSHVAKRLVGTQKHAMIVKKSVIR